MKRILLGILLILFSTKGFAQPVAVTSGIDWLIANQNTDKSWGGSTSAEVSSFHATTEVITAFQVTETTGIAYTDGLNWLNSQPVDTVNFAAHKLIIRTNASLDVSAELNHIISWRNTDGYWGLDGDYTTDTLETALAIHALKSANYSDQTVITNAITYLISTQNTDGGFGFYSGDESNVYMTSLVSSTLQQFQQTTSIATAVNKATSYIISQQQTNGGWGSLYETAHAYIALVSVSTDATVLGSAMNYITTTQSTNGSWSDDPYSTALALRALANVKPNLSIASSDITLSNPTPTVGDTIMITANIRNTGPLQAENVLVQFYDGDPNAGGGLIGEATILSIPSYSDALVAISYAAQTASSHRIYVKIDPLSTIDEITETDNIASKNLWIATGPDIAVYSEDLKPSTYVPASGTAFTLSYTLRNLGESDTGAFLISLYDGNPAFGGILLQTESLSGISGAQIRTGTMGVTLTGKGSHTLYLVADSAGQISELSEANNTGSVTVEVGGTVSGADLAVTSSEITFTPSRPTANETVQITANIRNQGTEVSGNFTIEIFDGVPESGGALISTQTLSLSPGASQTVTAAWTISQGVHDIYTILDRANAIIETDETNNQASSRIMSDMIDIAVSATDLVLNPSRPVTGDTVVLNMTVHNQGIRDTGAFMLSLYDGDPNAGGTHLQTFPISNLAGDGSATLTHTFIAEPKTYRFYAIADTENQVIEMYEDNNLAIRSLKIKAPGEILGPDLLPIKIDVSDTATDSQTLSITGTAKVTLQNKGDEKITASFDVLIFEDKDMDGLYTAGVDATFGTGANTLSLWPEGANIVDVPLLGSVQFLNAPLYAYIDSSDAIFEQDEANNLLRSGANCEVRPEKPIEPALKWKWQGATPYYGNTIASTPLVVNLTDDNGDGKIDQNDIPDIVFVGFGRQGGIGTGMDPYGKLWAVRGDTGATIFTVLDLAHPFMMYAHPAVGDIDNDGLPEIIIPKSQNYGDVGIGLVVYNHDGTLKWDNGAQVKAWNQAHRNGFVTIHAESVPAIADIDGDGVPEIIVGASVFNNDGSVRWGWLPVSTCFSSQSQNGNGTGSGSWPYASIVADIDLDGKQEIVAGNAVYDYNGNVKWCNTSLTDGITAVGNLDDDANPEIVLITAVRQLSKPIAERIYLLEHDGSIKWGPVYIDYGFVNTPPPIIADFDGDGKPEIGIKGVGQYYILDKNGNIKNTLPIPYLWPSFGYLTAGTVFDLNGDGRPEVMTNGDHYFRIFDGKNSTLLYENSFGTSGSSMQSVVIADVNGDDHAEIVAAGFTAYMEELRVYGAKNNDWVNTRNVWNQTSYHVTNVNDDGTIPQYESPSWLLNNTYRCQARIGEEPNPYLSPNLTASYFRMTQDGANLNLTVRIGNGGAKEAPSGVIVTFYDGDPASGIIIGTTATTKALNPGEYQDVTLAWGNGGIGTHQIYAKADSSNSIPECNEADNQTGFNAAIEQGLPDLKVTSEDITLPPGPYTEGSSITITASIKNIGPVSAGNVSVKLYNGNPDSGGVQIGNTQTISSILASAGANLTFTFDTFGYMGTNVLYLIVDPLNVVLEESETNNKASFVIEVTQALKPDLSIASSDITFSNLNPKEGEAFSISATIHNQGLDASDIEVSLYDGDPTTGTLLSQKTVSQIIPLGGQVVLSFDVNTIGFAGSHNFHISIDPNNKIDEAIETNNSASNTLTIGSSGASMGISLDKGAYTANENCLIDLTLTNIGDSSRTLETVVDIEDTLGNLVQTAATLSNINFAAGETKNFLDIVFNTGKTFNGNYRVHARLKDGGQIIGESFANFSILAVKQAASAITADKIAYSSNEPVTITSAVTSQSPNAMLTGLEATIEIIDPNSISIFSQTKSLSDLMPEARIEFKSFTNTGTYPAGIYTASLSVRSNGASLTGASATFEILSSLDQAKALSGTISANPSSIIEKESTTLSYTIQNIGNDIDLPLIQGEILIVDPGTQLSVRTITGEASLNGREMFSNTILFNSTGLAPKPYMIIVRATTAGVTQTLNSAGLIINPIPNNAPVANAGADQFAFVGQSVLLDGSQSSDPDQDPLSFTWHFTLLPNASQTTDASLSNSMTPTPSFVPDAEGIYTLSLVVNDGLADSQTDTVSVFVNPPAKVDIHPETINLKSNGGSKSITGVLASPVLSSFEFFTAEDGITITASFTLENRYMDKDGNEVVFTIPAEDYPGDDKIVTVDADGDGDIDLYQLTLKFNRDMLIAGFRDASGQLRITQATELTSTVIGNSMRLGSDINTVISPAEVSK